MASAWRVRAGTQVRHRTAAGRVQHAIVTDVTDQDTIDLRVGNGPTRLDVTDVALLTETGGTGWFRSSGSGPSATEDHIELWTEDGDELTTETGDLLEVG